MRQALPALIVTFGMAAVASAQGPVRIDITDGQFRAGMSVASEPYTVGGPWGSISARPLKPGVSPTATQFRVRSWMEGDGVRVLVFAVIGSGASLARGRFENEREEQIASLFVPIDRAVEIAATEKYRARRITLVASRPEIRPSTPRLVQHGIDVPPRPFFPTRR